MVGRLVKEQDVGLLQEQAAKSHAAALTPGQHVHDLLRRRAAERVHRKLQICVQIPCVTGVQFFLQLCLSCSQLVIVSVRVSECLVHLVEFCQKVGYGLHALHDDFLDGLARLKLRLLLQVAHRVSVQEPGLAGIVLVDSCENLEEGGLSCPVLADDAYLCAQVI